MSRNANCMTTPRVASEIANCKLPLRQLCFGMLFLLAAGCGKSGPELAPVKGRVTLDGRPLEMVDIVFQPANGKPPSTSRTDEDGHYEMLYKRGFTGARIGEHTVRIEFTSGIVAKPPNIPARYN